MVILFTLLIHVCMNLSSNTMLYYCNWVLADSVQAGATKQILVNVIGQGPMGFGIFLLWTLVRKFGKQKVTVVGFLIASLGALLTYLAGANMPLVLGGLVIKSFGSLPTYVMSAYLAEVIDHVEKQSGFRADGFTASINSIILTLATGISQTVLLAGINIFGYIAPSSAAETVMQAEEVRRFFSLGFVGFSVIGYAACAVIMMFYRAEREVTNQ